MQHATPAPLRIEDETGQVLLYFDPCADARVVASRAFDPPAPAFGHSADVESTQRKREHATQQT